MRLRTTCLSVIVFAGTALGGRGEVYRTDINPALQYYQAFLLAPDLAMSDSNFLFTNSWQGEKLPDRFGKLMSGYDNQLKLVRQAAGSKVDCDWGIDMSAGPATMLPQLARAKAVAQTTRLRVMWHLQNGRQDEARDELVAAFALARNIARDGTLIAMLVQLASEAIDCSSIAANFGRFSPEALKSLADGIDAAPTRRMAADCLGTEKVMFLNWMRNKVLELQKQNPGNDAGVMEELHQLLGAEQDSEGETNVWQRLTQAAGGTSDGVLRLLQQREQEYDKLVKIVALPYAEFEIQEKAFRSEVEHSPNPLVALTLPAFLKAREREFRVLATLALVRAGVEYKLHGEAGLKSVADPCGNGPFAFRRFVFEGVDRGFELKSAFNLGGNQAVLIFVEKEGAPFQVDGNYPGRPVTRTAPRE